MDNITEIIKTIGSTGLVVLTAVTGGIAKYSKVYLETGEFIFGKFLANVIISGFAGLMFGYFGENLGVTQNIILMFAGVGGFMGYETINYIFNSITKKKS